MTPVTLKCDAFEECAMEFSCPAQVLVIDRANGPADILVDLLGRLFEQQVSILLATGTDEVFYALNCCEFDLIIMGLGDDRADQFSLLCDLRTEYGHTPVMVVGDDLSHDDLEQCRQYAVHEAIEMPRRAAELKSAVFSIVQQYLQCA
jgi:CheY-like chemotaxis protein